jgi:hypothetical protein
MKSKGYCGKRAPSKARIVLALPVSCLMLAAVILAEPAFSAGPPAGQETTAVEGALLPKAAILPQSRVSSALVQCINAGAVKAAKAAPLCRYAAAA